jgi:hypothetical protein
MRTAATPASIARRARLALKWMSAITGQRREPDDLRQRVRVLALRHRHANDLAAGGGKGGDLRSRRFDVVRLRQGHRLHDDRRAAADLDAAYVD